MFSDFFPLKSPGSQFGNAGSKLMTSLKPPSCTEVSAQTTDSFVLLGNTQSLGRGALVWSCFGERWVWVWSQAAQGEKCWAGTEPDRDGCLSKHSVWPWEKPRQMGILGVVFDQNSGGKLKTEKSTPVAWLLPCHTGVCLSFVNKQSCFQKTT